MQATPTIHGICPDCGQEVVGGEGVTVTPTGEFWHSDCRKVHNRRNQTAVKRGPGRPRKADTETVA